MADDNRMESRELISVILPAYNCAQLIEAAVLSVLAQTYKDLELIIVDDSSGDNTSEICRFLAEKDDRIKVITNDNTRLHRYPRQCCDTTRARERFLRGL